jgi:epoxyqueuosine reductase
MAPSLKNEIKAWCAAHDIPMVGFASADAWDEAPFEPWVPKEFRPKAIWPEARSVIVIGLPISLPILETTPSIAYHELYGNVNLILDQTVYQLSNFLNSEKHASIYITRDGYGSIALLVDKPTAFFSHRHAAYLAGLGNFGVNNMLLTEEYGPRVRFASVFTDAEIPPDAIKAKKLCTSCQRCSKSCPTRSLGEADYPGDLTDKKKCSQYSDQLKERFISPCGVCIKVCPVGQDRELYRRQDMTIYENLPKWSEYHSAWKHVRSYGGK